MIDLVFRRRLITFGLTVNTERHLRGVRVRTDGSKLLKIQSDEVFGTDRYANRRSHHRSPLALAKSIRGTSDRQYPPRMPRPRDCSFRRASSKNSKEVFSLLPQFQTTSSARSELSHPTNR